MEQILEKIMNFINENTMLLILVCIFLIIILVIYLIDNTIKTRKLEKEELNNKTNPEPIAVEPTVVAPVVEEPKVEEVPVQPVVEPTPVAEEPVVAPVEEIVPETKVEEPKVEETAPVVEPTVTTADIEALLNKDYSSSNEVVNNIDTSIPVEQPKTKYTNDKKLSDIFGKKEEKKIETTQDFSDELDRILQKLNNEEKSSTLEETNDYTNMF